MQQSPAPEESGYELLLDQEAQTDHLPKANNQEVALSKPGATAKKRIHHCIDWKEVKLQCWLAGPMIIVNVLNFSLQLISVMFVGHFGELELSSASIASSFAVVSGSSVLLGMGSALETLCGQAYGAGQFHMLGIYMQRAMVVLNITGIPLAFIWANIGKILLALGQDPDISSKAGDYGRWLIPTLFAYASAQPAVKFLQAQSLVVPLVFIAFSTLCCHLPICWFMVYKSGLGYQGAALATSISNWINALMLQLYVRFSRTCEKTRSPWSREALHDLKGFFKLALPSAAMICLEWWSYEVLVILSGLLPNPELQTSALSICISTSSLMYMVPYGLSAAASTRVSNELGAGHPQTARAAINVAMGLALSEALILSTTLFLARNIWGHAYSSEKDVVDYVASLFPVLAGSTFMDSMQAVLSGVARGAGWQKAGAFINLGSFYIAGLPTGCLLAFVAHLAGKGLLVGIICGSSVQFISLVALTRFTNWDKEAMQAAARVDSSLASTEPLLSTLK